MATTRISARLRLELLTTWLKEMETNRAPSALGSRDQAHTALSFPGCVGLAPAPLLDQSPDGAATCVREGAPTLGLRTSVPHPSGSPSARSPAAPPAPALTIAAAARPARLLCQKSRGAQRPGGSRGRSRGGVGALSLTGDRGQVQIESSWQQRLGSLGRLLPGPLATRFGW